MARFITTEEYKIGRRYFKIQERSLERGYNREFMSECRVKIGVVPSETEYISSDWETKKDGQHWHCMFESLNECRLAILLYLNKR